MSGERVNTIHPHHTQNTAKQAQKTPRIFNNNNKEKYFIKDKIFSKCKG